MNDTSTTARERLDRLLSRAADHANRASTSAIGSALQELREALADRERFTDSLVEEFVRARAPEALRTPVANVLSTAGSSVAPEDLDELTELLAAVILIEGTSLGTPEAQRVRGSASPADLATVERLGVLLEQAGSALAPGPQESAPPRPEDDLAEAIRLVDELREAALVQYRNMDRLHAHLERLREQFPGGGSSSSPQREHAPAAARSSPKATPSALGDRPPRTTFWGSLTPHERRALEEIGHTHVFRSGVDLWHEGEPAQEVLIIRSGWARMWIKRNGKERVVSFRGAGELVGERPALLLRRHSSTATAAGDVDALRIGIAEFAGFLSEHPRVLALLERQHHDEESAPGRQPPYSEASDGDSTILVTEVHGFGSSRLDDDDRLYLRESMYAALEDAFTTCDIDFTSLYREDRGDGALVVVPPGVPTSLLIGPIAARLATELRRRNQEVAERVKLRLRTVVHTGHVQRDPQGVSGPSIITAWRIVGAPKVKEKVTRTAADLALVVSDSVFQALIAPGYGSVDPSRFSRISIQVKETTTSAWLALEGATRGSNTILKDASLTVRPDNGP